MKKTIKFLGTVGFLLFASYVIAAVTISSGNRVAQALGGDGSILDGVTSTIKATVFNYTNSKPIATTLVDSAGAQLATVPVSLASVPSHAVTGTFWQSTQPVSGTFFQTTQPVSGTFWQATQPVSGSMTVTQPTGTNLHFVCDGGTCGTTGLAQGSTTSGQTGPLNQAAVTTAAPTYTTGQTNPLSLTTAGRLRTETDIATCSGCSVDSATFTAATSAASTMGGVYNDGVAALTSGQSGAQRLTSDRMAYANIGKFGGSLVSLGQNNKAASIPVTIASDQGSLGTFSSSDVCQANTKVYASINGTASKTLITGTGGKTMYICSLNIVTATAQNINIVSGSSTVCATGMTEVKGLAGGVTAATGWNLPANGGLTFGNGEASIAKVANAGDDLCLLSSSSGQISGGLSYVVL